MNEIECETGKEQRDKRISYLICERDGIDKFLVKVNAHEGNEYVRIDMGSML